MKDRIIKASEIKKALQMMKKSKKEFKRLDLGMCGDQEWRELQVASGYLRKLAKIFGVEIMKFTQYGDVESGYIYIEGVQVYSYKYEFDYDKKLNYTYTDKQLQTKLKEYFFETGDKPKAFELMRKDELNSCSVNYVKYSWASKYKTLEAFEKHLNRVKKKSYEQIWQEYLVYKNNWVSYYEDEKKKDRPLDDYSKWASFREWYEYKY